jgi:hypothetical protein
MNRLSAVESFYNFTSYVGKIYSEQTDNQDTMVDDFGEIYTLDSYVSPVYWLDLSNNLYVSPKLNSGFMVNDTIETTLYPFRIPGGSMLATFGYRYSYVTFLTNNYSSVKSNSFIYALFGYSFYFEYISKLRVVPKAGVGQEYISKKEESRKAALSDYSSTSEKLYPLGGFQISVFEDKLYYINVYYEIQYDYETFEQSNSVTLTVTRQLINQFGLSYRFYYHFPSDDKEVHNSLGLQYSL